MKKEEYNNNQKEMKVYNKEVCRYTKSGETSYQCLICKFKIDLSHTTPLEHTLVKKISLIKNSIKKMLIKI